MDKIPSNIVISRDSSVSAHEILKLRDIKDSQNKTLQMWEKCIKQSMCTVSAREEANELIGVGFIVGNARHGELVDLFVHPSYRQHGVAAGVVNELLSFTKEKGILYVGLTYDKNNKWLKSFYEKHGFESIDFAMWQKDSLKKLERR